MRPEHDELPLAADVAHELRNPLAAIAGFAGLLELRGDEKTRRTAVRGILEACKTLSATIDELAGSAGESAETGEPPRSLRRPAPGPGASPIDTARRRHRVLLVDDDATIRTLLRTTLSADRFQISEAGDGREALASIAAQRPDVVLLDWNMPVASGPYVLAELQRADANIPVVVLTAQQHPRYRATAERLGARRFLTKPFSPVDLLDAIDELVDEPAAP